jgi:hypothetical protein
MADDGWNAFISRVSVVRSHPPLLREYRKKGHKRTSEYSGPLPCARRLYPGLNHAWHEWHCHLAALDLGR